MSRSLFINKLEEEGFPPSLLGVRLISLPCLVQFLCIFPMWLD